MSRAAAFTANFSLPMPEFASSILSGVGGTPVVAVALAVFLSILLVGLVLIRLAPQLKQAERFRCIVDSLPSAILHLDTQGNPLWANRHWRELAGARATECAPSCWEGAILPDDRDLAAELWELSRRAQRREGAEVRSSNSDEERWFRISFIPIIKRKRCTGFICKLVDISRRKQSELQLERSERRYRMVTENAHDMLFRIGPRGQMLFVSNAVQRILGFDPARLLGRDMRSLVHDEDWPQVARHFDAVESTAGGHAEFCYRQLCASGDYLWVEANTRLLHRHVDGAPHEIVATVRDIQKRREMQRSLRNSTLKLREANRLLRLAEGLARIGSWRLDFGSGEFIHSRHLAQMAGGERDSRLSARDFLRMLAPDDRRLVLVTLSRAQRSARPSHCSARICTLDGEQRHVRLVIQADTTNDGNTSGLFGVVRDVTLELRAQSDLVAARDRAKKAAAAKSAFLAVMSHEIRTPMTGVLGMIDLLLANPSEQDRKLYVDTLKQSADLLMTVLDDILDFSRIESGRLTLDRREMRFEDVIEDTIKLFESAASAKGVELWVEGNAEGAEPAWGDPIRLRQVLANILSNAVKFTEEGEIVLRYEVMPERDRQRWRVSVSDSGIGIEPKMREKLFEPFGHLETSAHRAFGGTGLGLAISHQLVHAMGGEIGVESIPGDGATFWFEVTLEGATASPETGERPAPSAEGPYDNSPSLRVLVAEDNPVNQLLLAAVLRQLGHEAHIVDNGVKAVEAAARESFDAILLDMHMPEMDGAAAACRIRDGGSPNASVPILALTADASPERRRQFEDAGLDALLTKPIDRDELAARLAQCIQPSLAA